MEMIMSSVFDSFEPDVSIDGSMRDAISPYWCEAASALYLGGRDKRKRRKHKRKL
jgi:hypothetical protein